MAHPDSDFDAAISEAARRIADSWLNNVIIEALTHGLFSALVVATLYTIFSTSSHDNQREKKKHRRRLFMAFFVIFLYCIATIHLGLRWWWLRHLFVSHGATEKTRIEEATANTRIGIFFRGLSSSTAGLNTVLADCVLIWRCWTVWNRNWKIIVLPVLCTICGTVCCGMFIAQQCVPVDTTSTSKNLYNTLTIVNWATVYFAMSLATTMICTILIIAQIVRMSAGAHFGGWAVLRTYRHAIEIVVESAALYAVGMTVFMILFARDQVDGTSNAPYAQALLSSIVGIAPTLIILRVASGEARPDEAWRGDAALSLYFDKSSPSASSHSGIISGSALPNIVV